MSNNFFVSCVESRLEQETSWYSRFEIGPFSTGQALTVANSLRRTLLSDQQGVFLTAVEIDGAIHEYSRLEGVRESILDILLNLRQVSLLISPQSNQNNDESENQETFFGYFDIQGPMEVRAKDLKFPKHLECTNPNQVIATLTRNCQFQGRFLIMKNAGEMFKNQAIGDPLIFSKQTTNPELTARLLDKNWLYVNPIVNPIRRVNYVIEQFGDVWEQKEVIVFEIWTNGTIHPKQVIHNACLSLSNLFAALASFNMNTARFSSAISRFKTAKTDLTFEGSGINRTNFDDSLTVLDTSTNKLAILFDLDLANLNLSLKTYLVLKTAKVENIGNLLQYKKVDLSSLLNLSDQQIQEVENALTAFGLHCE